MSTNPDKPLLAMTPEERQDVFDALGTTSRESILAEAREACMPIRVAAMLLTRQDGIEVVAYYDPEYGDGEGERVVDDLVAEVIRVKTLRPGESVRRVVLECLDMREVPGDGK